MYENPGRDRSRTPFMKRIIGYLGKDVYKDLKVTVLRIEKGRQSDLTNLRAVKKYIYLRIFTYEYLHTRKTKRPIL